MKNAMNIPETYFGFTDSIKEPRKTKVENTLDKVFNIKDKYISNGSNYMSRKEYVLHYLKEGRTLEIEENYSYYSPRLEAYTKPKKRIKLIDQATGRFIEITKTEYDFANYLLDNNFLDDEKAQAFIDNENKQKEEALKAEQEQQQMERDAAERKRLEEEQAYKERLQQKRNNWYNIGSTLMTDNVKEMLFSILDSYWNDIIGMYPETNKNELYQNMLEEYTTTLGNKEYCITWLQYHVEELKNDDITPFKRNPSRVIERNFFIKLFNATVNDCNRTLTAKVKAFHDQREYKGSATKQNKIETFFISNTKEDGFIEVEGERLTIDNMELFIYKDNDGKYAIHEMRSGASLTGKETNKKVIVDKAKELLKNNRKSIDDAINRFINKFGLSPNELKLAN